MVDQAPQANTSSSTSNQQTITTIIDGQDMTCVPVKAPAAEGDKAATPIISAVGSEETVPLNLNEIAPAAGTPACDIPGRVPVSADALANAVTVTKPEAGQTKTYAALNEGQTYNMTFNYTDALVEREGKNVVIRFADGSVIILEDFADKASSTKLIADECEAAPLQFASLNNIAPAAGPVATAPQANTAPGNTGAGFNNFDAGNPPNLNDPTGPLGFTELTYRQIDGLQPELGTFTRDGRPNGIVGISEPLNLVDETGGGGSGGDFSAPRVTGGPISIDYGPDGAGNVRILSGPTSLTHRGEAITVEISPDGLTATGKTPDGTPVFVFTIDPTTSSYTFTQNASLDHPIPGNPNEPLDLPFVIRVTDADGDFADGTATMRVLDDAPSATTTTANSATVDESDSGTLSAGGNITFSYGGDSFGSVKLVGGPSGLTSQGQPVGVTITDTLVTGTAGGSTVFTLTLNPTTGAWEYQQFAPLDHANASDPNDAIDLGFTVRITDYDGDSVDTPIFVKVLDDGPSTDGNALAQVDETGGFDSVTANLPIGFGEDGPGSVKLTSGPAGLSTGGQAVIVTISDDGLSAVGRTAGGDVVFELTLDPANREFTFTQYAPLDHADAADHNDVLGLGFTYQVTDFDGDTANGAINVSVYDDGPTAGTASFSVTDLGSAVSGTLPGEFGEDGAGSFAFTGSVTGLTSGGQAVTVIVTGDKVEGRLPDNSVVFSMTLGGSSYNFVQFKELDGNPVINLGYKVTDNDGDVATGTIKVSTRVDGYPQVGVSEDKVVDETGGFDTVSGNLNYSFGPDGAGSLSFLSGPSGLTSKGVPVVVTFDGSTATGKAGDVTVFTVTLDAATGKYTFTQLAQLDHPNASNPDDALNLRFDFRVADADGDNADGFFRVTVKDDGPSITGVHRIAVDETNATDTVGAANDGIWATATSGTPLSASGTVTHSFGQDGRGTLTLTSAPSTLKHHGESVVVTIAGNTATGKLADGTLIFTLTLDASTGAYEFKQYASLDHANTSDHNDILQLSFGMKITDYDGDSANALLTLKVRDDGPTGGKDEFCIDQSQYKDDGNPLTPVITTTGKLNFSYGDDGKGYLKLTDKPSGIFSNGQAILVTLAGGVFTGKTAAGETIFTLDVKHDGTYTYKQYAEIDAGSSTATNLNFGYVVVDGDKDCDAGSLNICIKGDLDQPEPPQIAVTVTNKETVTSEHLTFNHQFDETRTWKPVAKESTPVDKNLIGISATALVIGDNYTVPANLVGGPLMHQLKLTFEGEVAGYSNTLGWFIVGPNGEIQDVKLAVLNSDAFAKGGTVDLGAVAAGTQIEFFILPNAAQLNNYSNLAAGGSFQFWVGGAPGSSGGQLAEYGDVGAKLYYVNGSSATEIKTAVGQIYFASNETMNADGVDHIAAGMDPVIQPGELWLGFEDLKNGGDVDYNDLMFRLSVGPAHGEVQTKSFCSDLTALVSDPDSTALSGAVVNLNGVSGDMLELGAGYTVVSGNVLLNGVDTGVDFTQSSNGGFTLTGGASLATYQGILDSVQLDANGNADGLRTANFQITDETGLNSNVAQVSLYPACGCGEDDSLASGVKDAAPGYADVYVYTPGTGCQTITGFNKYEGDKLDLKQVLETHCSSEDDLSNFVKVECHDGNTVVSLDSSGSGQHFTSIAVLSGVTGCTLDSMIADGSLEVGRFSNS